ncbi:helicase-related protein [Desulfocucumis palustris]|nr:helicase-related protein [Desulfocucumis palustris]
MAKAGGKPSATEVVFSIQDHLPALYFAFGRGKTELLAEEISREWDFLLPGEKEKVAEIIREAEVQNTGLFGHRRHNLKQILIQGIGYHHAGMSPALKDLVERLYESRLIYVLFCTETFAVGVNFPAASTVFDSCRKWDGREFRGLLNREFYQMAGRAGRRGFDPIGHVFVRIDDRFPEQTGFYREDEVEPVRGRLAISPNTVLSLLYWKTDEEINRFLEQNLAAYQNNRESRRLKGELEALEGKNAELGNCFCENIYQPSCFLLRAKLKNELRSLSRRRKRGRPGSRERREEIRAILKVAPKKCQHHLCVDARKKQDLYTEKRTRLSRRLKVLDRHSRDFEMEFNNMWDLLEALDYVDGRELLPRGLFALYLHVQEILVTELIFNGYIRDRAPQEVVAILSGVDYIPGREEYVEPGLIKLDHVEELRKYLLKKGVPENFCVWSHLPGPLSSAWYDGAAFEELMARSSLQEGDIFSMLRRTIDLLRQIERAAGEDVELRRQMEHIRHRLDRDEVAIMGI